MRNAFTFIAKNMKNKDEKWEKASCTMGKPHAPFKRDGAVHLFWTIWHDITHTYAKALSLCGQ